MGRREWVWECDGEGQGEGHGGLSTTDCPIDTGKTSHPQCCRPAPCARLLNGAVMRCDGGRWDDYCRVIPDLCFPPGTSSNFVGGRLPAFRMSVGCRGRPTGGCRHWRRLFFLCLQLSLQWWAIRGCDNFAGCAAIEILLVEEMPARPSFCTMRLESEDGVHHSPLPTKFQTSAEFWARAWRVGDTGGTASTPALTLHRFPRINN
jgi:hypothetical protein